jgi:dienelactone hydrolase
MTRFDMLISAAVFACCTLTGGCAHTEKPEARQLSDPGYVSKRHFTTSASQDTWLFKDTTLDVSLLAPNASGAFPLVIYLPGLGESTDAAVLWRNAWAQAGYAVLSIQPHDLGESIWRSPRARAGNFAALAADQFSPAARAARTAVLVDAFAELRRRAASGQAPYARVDLQHVAIAGFDLGAATAASIATSGLTMPPGWVWRAAIILSPPAPDGAAAAGTTDAIPFLCITGTADTDPFGLTASPRRREAACAALPARDRYAVVLSNANHALLSGTNTYSDDPIYANGAADPSAGGRPWKRPRSPQLQQNDYGHPELSEEPDDGPRQKRRRAPVLSGPGPFDPKLLGAVQAISTAFLDSTLRDDALARAWLAKDAAVWLGDSGVLRSAGLAPK